MKDVKWTGRKDVNVSLFNEGNPKEGFVNLYINYPNLDGPQMCLVLSVEEWSKMLTQNRVVSGSLWESELTLADIVGDGT
jgi:hypothetical protein